MKTIYPFFALLSAAVVAAGPVPRIHNLDTRSNDLVHTSNQARTEPVAVPAPASVQGDAEAEKQRLAAEQAGKQRLLEYECNLTLLKLQSTKKPQT
jgi:hypothetical protein